MGAAAGMALAGAGGSGSFQLGPEPSGGGDRADTAGDEMTPRPDGKQICYLLLIIFIGFIIVGVGRHAYSIVWHSMP